MSSTVPSSWTSQKREMDVLLNQKLKKGDTWYLVDATWMKSWKKYTGYDYQFYTGKKQFFPGPVETSSLFSTRTGNTLRDHLIEGIDYNLVPEKAWETLVQWYGLSPTSRPIARKVVEYTDHHPYTYLKVEVFPLNFKLSMYPELDKFTIHQFSRQDTIGDMESVMRGLYSIPIETHCRVWHLCMSKLYELLDDKSKTIQAAGLYNNIQTIVIEKQNMNGSWPSPYSESITRQVIEQTDRENAKDSETFTVQTKESSEVKLSEDDWLLKQQQSQHDELVESVTAEHKRANQASQRAQDALDRLARRETQIQSLNKSLEENLSEVETLGNSLSEEQERRVNAETRVSKLEGIVTQLQNKLQRVTGSLQTAEEGIKQKDNHIKSLEEEKDVAINRMVVLENELCIAQQQQQETAQQLQTCQHQLQQAFQRADQQQQQVTIAETRLQHSDEVFQDMLHRLLGQLPQSQPHWVIQRNEIELTDEELGQGGWATVNVGIFRGNRIAAKCLHRQIVSAHNVRLFTREMSMAANARHPNLLQFIGATLDDQEPIIITELMPTSLRQVMEEGTRFTHPHIMSISHQVALALNYLHLTQPEAIIHRDVSSSNVLLDSLIGGSWKAKLSDYGSANFVRHITTAGPGNPTYSAPEVNNPEQQSTKMDVFSFGVLLVEMCSGELSPAEHRDHLLNTIQWSSMVALIRQCLKHEPYRRPDMNDIITQLQLL